MNNIVLVLLCFVLMAFNTIEPNVYICGTVGAKKYHYSETCRGLNACKHEIVKKTVKEAQSLGLTLCGWED
jgi:hypothetical protein